MVSRKKAAAKARKAAKAKAREEQAKEMVAAQMRQLSCQHGADPQLLNTDNIVFQCVHTFGKVFNEAENHGELSSSLLAARAATSDEFVEVWHNSAKTEMVISILLSKGTQDLLDGKYDDARKAAAFARQFEQHNATVLQQTHSLINWPKIFEMYYADMHTLVKFFWKRIPCSCLDEKCQEVKDITKMGYCWSPHCKFPNRMMERNKTKYCSRCRNAVYCSRECQEADWSRHKCHCDLCTEVIAKFEARQQISKA